MSTTSTAMMLLKSAAIVGFGFLEGYAFARAGLLAPVNIVRQMRFESFVVLKVFLSAVGTSMLGQSLMSWVAPGQFNASRKYARMSTGIARAVVGCSLLGMGMSIAGSGPTLIPGQIATLANGITVLAGGILGGALYAIVQPTLFPADLTCEPATVLLDVKTGSSYATLAIPMGIAMMAGAFGAEAAFPHSAEPSFLGGSTLSPILAGAVVGLNQIPLRFLAGHGQGGSSSVMSLLNAVSFGHLAKKFQLDTLAKGSQLLYVYGGTLLGAWAVAHSWFGETMYKAAPVDTVRCVVGGAIMIFGARLANGCTCGHGITGVSELNVESFFAAASIFAGGIATAALLPV